MIFFNRTEAGKGLAKKLQFYHGNKDTVAVGLARGGVVVAAEIAKTLNLSLDVMVVRKIGAPDNPELALGAVAEKGEGIFNDELISLLGVSQEYLQKEMEKQKEIVKERRKLYLNNRRSVSFEGKVILLIDDGMATGASMKVAIESAKAQKAKKIVVAFPVAPADAIETMQSLVDEVICLLVPMSFPAVGAFYKEFEQVSDEEIMTLLRVR